MSTNAAPWPIGSTLELTAKKCGFPQVSAPDADLAQPYQLRIVSDAPFILHGPERVRFIRHLGSGKHIVCHHSSGVFFASSSQHFSLIQA